MREMVRIEFREKYVPGGKEAILSRFEFESGAVEIVRDKGLWDTDILVHLHLEKDDGRLLRLRAELQRLDVGWAEKWYDSFTQEELDAAPRLLVVHDYSILTDIPGGAEYGTQYDLAQGCPACGSGSPQISPLCIDGNDAPSLVNRRVAKTYEGDFLVSEDVAEQLDRLGIPGLELGSVFAVDSETARQTKLPWRQLSAKKTAPPRSPRTTGLFLWNNEQCQVCKRENFALGDEAPLRLCYGASDLAQFDEVTATWEVKRNCHLALGPDQAPLIRRPWLLVTPRVMRALQSLGFTKDDCEFIPIRVVNE